MQANYQKIFKKRNKIREKMHNDRLDLAKKYYQMYPTRAVKLSPKKSKKLMEALSTLYYGNKE